jgi:cell division protein YceG involved in septum cleavage
VADGGRRSSQDRAAARRERQARRVKRDGDGEVRGEPAVPAFVRQPDGGGRPPRQGRPRAQPRPRTQRPRRRGGGGFSRLVAIAALLIAVAVVVVVVLKLVNRHHSAPRAVVKEKTTNVTIIPGDTRRKLDRLLRSQGVKGSYYKATRSSPLLSPQSYGAPASVHSLEGFLFPDTYNLRQPISMTALVNDQLTEFRKVWPTVNLSYARAHHLTPYDVLIIASMVEGEAATARDRALVASVIYNRLAQGMPLQIDATTRYATGNYTQPLTQKQLHSPSPYNTRIHPGLPPTPIDSPSLASIQAAAHPAQTNYLYFVVKPCGNGTMDFTSSYQQFLADTAAYQQARAKLGRSPTHC